MKRLIRYIFKNKKLLYVVFTLSFFTSIFTLAIPLLSGALIYNMQTKSPSTPVVVVGLLVTVFFSSIFAGLQHYFLQRIGEGIVFSARQNLISKILSLSIVQFDKRPIGDVVSRVASDTVTLRAVLTQGFVESFGGAITFLGAIIAMLILDYVLFLITFACIGTCLLIVFALARKLKAASRASQVAIGQLSSALERSIASIRIIKASNAEERSEEELVDLSQNAYKKGLRIASLSAFIVPASFMAIQISIAVVMVVGGIRVTAGHIHVSVLIAFIMFLFTTLTPLAQFFGAISSVSTALGAFDRISEILDLKDETYSDKARKPALTPAGLQTATAIHIKAEDVKNAKEPLPAAIEFQNVSFYRTTEHDTLANEYTLNDVSFSIEQNSHVALVGPSGGGKSTILCLMERFYEITSGKILIFGQDIRDISRFELRNTIAYAQQNAHAIAGTIRKNLALEAPAATDEQYLEALADVNLANLAPNAQDLLNIPIHDGATGLSGGQLQRLAIARTLLSRKPILLLDESTSALDGKNETLMQNAISKISTKRTIVTVAHRISTVLKANKIIVVHKGKIDAIGTHATLLKDSQVYQQIFRNQLMA